MSEDDEAEVQIALVRAMRVYSSAKEVLSSLEKEFPHLTREEIRKAYLPLLQNLLQH